MYNFKDFSKDEIIILAKNYNNIIKRCALYANSYVPHTIYVSDEGIEWILAEIVDKREHIITFYKSANPNNFLNVSIHLEEYLEVE